MSISEEDDVVDAEEQMFKKRKVKLFKTYRFLQAKCFSESAGHRAVKISGAFPHKGVG